jgi:uncharacterized protein (TIGR03435 family)
MSRLTLAFTWAVMFTIGRAQTQKPEFEVASVKSNKSLEANISLNRTPGGGFDAVNVPLQMLITFAYDVRDHQLFGAPAWLVAERYDVHAKPPAEESRSPASDEFRLVKLRLQNLLADRFKLAVHRDTRQMPEYALVVSRNGSKLQLWKEGDERGPQIIGRGGSVTCWKVNMRTFAEDLSRRLGRTVVDTTGLNGDYNFRLQYQPDQPGSVTADLPGPALRDALEEQIGLKLESRRGPVEVLVIEHIERPSAN